MNTEASLHKIITKSKIELIIFIYYYYLFYERSLQISQAFTKVYTNFVNKINQIELTDFNESKI